MNQYQSSTTGKHGAEVWAPKRSHVALFRHNLIVAGLYWAVAVLVRWYFSQYQMWPAPLWLSSGIAMYAAFLMGSSAAPGIFLGSLLTNLISFHGSPLSSLVVATGNTLGPLVAVSWLRKRIGEGDPFARVSYLLLFCMSCIAHGIISAVIGSSAIAYARSTPLVLWPGRWMDWAVSDSGACLLLVPLFLLLQRDPLGLSRIVKDRLEAAVTITLSLGAVAYFLSGSTGLLAVDAGSSFLILLPLLWAAVRFGARFAYPIFVSVIAILIVATLAGHGPYADVEKGSKFFIFAQMSLGLGISILLLGAISEQHRTAEKALRKLNQDLESRIERRTAELQNSNHRLKEAAFHDVLTGLPNRRFFEDRFAAAQSHAARNGTAIAFLLIDLDHFKQINDTLGHDAGDALLVSTGVRLTKAVREYDFVARLGGDEFAVLLVDMPDRAQVDVVCSRIVSGLRDRVFFNGKDVGTSPSVGVALFPDDGTTWHELYKSADLALYAAKQNGRGRWEWYRSLVHVSSGL